MLQAILGISWFWFLGIVLVTQMQLFTVDSLKGTPAVASLIFRLFSVGLGLGSIYCNKLLNGAISVKYVPLAALLVSVFLIDIYFAAGSASLALAEAINSGALPTVTSEAGDRLLGFAQVMSFPQSWRVLFDMLAVTFCCGIFVVPLYAVMQVRTPYYLRARIVGSNNIINAIFMVAATIISIPLLGAGISARGLFLDSRHRKSSGRHLHGEAHAAGVRLLHEKYPQYKTMPLDDRPIIVVTPLRVISWGTLSRVDET